MSEPGRQKQAAGYLSFSTPVCLGLEGGMSGRDKT